MNTSRIKIPALLVTILYMIIPSFSLFAQDEEFSIVISEIETEIDGSTREKSLLDEIEIYEGKSFKTYDDLILFLDEAKQDLINMRVFEEVEYSLDKLNTINGLTEYKVILKVRDTFTFYPIPYPKYNSNTGGRLGLKIFYYNAFGTMTDWHLFTNMDINKDEFDNWDIPSWHITPAVEGINILGQDFRAEYSHKYKTISTTLNIDSYHNDSLSLGTKFYLPMDFYYSIDPRLGVNYAVEGLEYDTESETWIKNPDADPRNNENIDILEFSWIHSAGYNHLDWIGNFRNGFSASLSNTLTVSSDLEPHMPVQFSASLTGTAMYFWRINKRFNFSTLGKGLISFNKEMSGIGEHLRGVRDDQLFGDKALIWSVDMNISVIDWDGVLEAQFRPFFNLGYARNDFNDQLNEEERNMLAYGVGADFVLYLDKLNALQARGTIGIDLSQYDWSDGEKYEIDITTSLSY